MRAVKLKVQSGVWMEADGKEGNGGIGLEDERRGVRGAELELLYDRRKTRRR